MNLRDGVVLADGAMGTELLARGFTRERPLEELNLTRPGAVLAVHRAYLEAGCRAIRTNTFQAARAEHPREVARAAVRIARSAGPAWVIGCCGPGGDLGAVFEGLADEGCGAVLLETFLDPGERERAAAAAGRRGLRVIPGTNCRTAAESLADVARGAVAAFPSAGLPPYPLTPEAFADAAVRLVLAGARLVGGCCGTTPAHLRAAARRLGR